MAREIRLDAIHDEKFYKDVVKVVASSTLLWEELTVRFTPEVSGNLKRSWNSDIKPFLGVVSTNVEYAGFLEDKANHDTPYISERYQPYQDTKTFAERVAKDISLGVSKI